MTLKVFQLAKELGVDSKAILKKCKEEQIPDIDTHRSNISAGLAATIREWAQAGELGAAVEEAKQGEAAKGTSKKRPSRAKKGQEAESGDGEGGSATAVAEPPPTVTAPSEPETTHAEHVEAAHAKTKRVTPSISAEAPVVEAAPAPLEVEAPAPPAPAPVAPVTPAAPLHAAAKAPAPEAPPAPAAPVAPVKPALQKPVRPVQPMGIKNVPNRPTTITPVGQQLVVKPAEVKGPNVVRMEQPDNLPAPRARPRPAGGQQMDAGQSRAGGPLMPPMPSSAPAGGARVRSRGESAPIVDDEEALRAKKNVKGRSARRHGTGRHADSGTDALREWRDADRAEYEERISSASGYLKERRREMSKTQQRAAAAAAAGPAVKPDHVEVMLPITIKDLSEAMGIKSSEMVKKLMSQGVMATVNQTLDGDTAQTLALEFGIELVIKERESEYQVQEREYKELEANAEKTPRPPVVTILGHVDHGKTSLLDKIRSANVAAGEAGGITQHVGAYTVALTGSDGREKRVTFLDTPGHQAFTAMRARGANMTDVVVLVVAADDGVMPQTVESINHAKAAGVPIVVAMNKIDKQEANANKVLGQLAENGLNPTEWGGDTEVVRTSAVSGQGVKELIEYLDYVAQLRDLKASPQLAARGSVIEAFMDPLRGVIARVLVQNGTLKIGDVVVCGPAAGRVRVLMDDKGKGIKEATPAMPVELIGLDTVPAAGDSFYVVKDLTDAKAMAETRAQTDRDGEIAQRNKVTLENLFDSIQKEEIKEFRLILKADVQGSMDVLKQLMTEELSKEVKVRLLHAAVGGISESDVLLAEASKAIIIGFNVVADEVARKLAEDEGVEIRTYRIIYEITDDIRKALTGMLAPSKQDQVLGHADVRQVIKISRVGNVAGCMVTDGVLQRNNKYRLTRDGTIVAENLTLDSLKRFKEDVKEVRGGMECGIKVAGHDDVKVGDRFEAYKTIDVARTL